LRDKAQLGVLDFEDLQIKTRNLLRDHSGIREHYRKNFATLLVDEHQDTDPLQMEIIELLAGGEEGRIFVVGDDKQSIYGFRGADVTVFRDYRAKTAKNGGGCLISLKTNFRSQEEILRFINHLFGRIFPSGNETIPFEGLDPFRKSLPNEHFIESCLIAAAKEEKKTAEEIRQEEAAALALRIRSMVDKGEKRILSDDGEPRAVQFGDIALLFRAMTDVRIYEDALLQYGIPFTVVSGGGFFKKQEVLDILNFLRLLLNPENDEALAALLRSPAAGVRDDTLYFMTRGRTLSSGLTVAEALDGIDDSEKAILIRTRKLLEDFRHIKNRVEIPELIGGFLDRTGYGAALLADPVYGRQRHANLQKLMDMGRDFSAGPFFGPADFIDYIDELMDRETREGESPVEEEGEDTVKILSIHKAKGLEFPVVILPDLGRNAGGRGSGFVAVDRHLGIGIKIPDGTGGWCSGFLRKRIEETREKEEIEEGKRLFYVAATRARDFLVLSGQVKRSKNPGREAALPMEWLCEALGITEENCREEISYGGRQIRPITPPRKPASEAAETVRWIDRFPELLSGEIPDLSGQIVDEELAKQVFKKPRCRPSRRFTVSQLLLIRKCPRMYELATRFGISEPEVKIPPHGTGGEGGRERGSLVHRILQQWDLRRENLSGTLDLELARSGYPETDQQAIRSEITPWLEVFAQSGTAEEIRRSGQAYAEIPFYLNLQGYRIEGVIDKLYRGPSGRLMILDYKTDGISAEEIETRAAEYRLQLSAYALAVYRLFGEEVETALAFLQPGIIRPIDHDPGRTEIEIIETIRAIDGVKSPLVERTRCLSCGYRESFCMTG